MADYSRRPRRFLNKGMSLLPEDALPEGKNAFLQNVRSYQEGTITPRAGSILQTTAPVAAPVHSIFRLNDTTPFGGGNPERRIIGAGTVVYAGNPGVSAYNNINGALAWSGNPLTAVAAAPFDSPRPYLYLADSLTMRKINSDLQDSAIGTATPLTPPSALYDAIQTTMADRMGGDPPFGAWVEYGVSVGPTNIVLRNSSTITQILYDSGTTGMATVGLSDMTGVVRGSTLKIDALPATFEYVIVQDIHPPCVSTTIAAIQYDVGTSGLCTIQPTGSLSIGQIEAPNAEDVRQRYEQLNLPVPPRVSVTRTIDFPVDSMVMLNALEAVRILSVAYGQNGELSFRCSTTNTFAAGNTIDGISSFRAYLTLTKGAGTPVIAFTRENHIPTSTSVSVVGGIQETPNTVPFSFAVVGSEATQPSDIIRFGFYTDRFDLVESVRLLLNVDPVTTDFLRNYYMYEWRASDLLVAIQAAAGESTGLVSASQQGAVTIGQSDALYRDQYGQRGTPDAAALLPPPGTGGGVADTVRRFRTARERLQAFADGQVAVGSTTSRQLIVGNRQWVWLQCRVGDLTRIGNDLTRTLAHINQIALTTQVGPENPSFNVLVAYGDLYLTGGYGPDTGPTLPPYVYRYRWRRQSTGEKGNPSPPMRGGVTPQRGRINLTGTQGPASDAVTDWFRFGGALARWAYVGTSPQNQNPPILADDRADAQIDGGETLSDDFYQPWPTNDLPRAGTGHCAGTSFTYQSGDLFDTDWAAGSVIIINGRATTLYKQPASTTRLDVVDNVGAANNVEWTMPGPILLGQPLPAMWGGAIGGVVFLFACADPSDPGLLHWTHGNDPDATSPVNTLSVTSGSEPLIMGFIDDGTPYVFSSDRLYRIVPTFGEISTFRAVETQCTKGLWSRWFLCVTDDGVFFGNKSGIYLTSGGSEAQSLVDDDLRRIFPQDGVVGQSVRGIDPPDFSQPTRLKLTYVDRRLYFDYVNVSGVDRTLVLDPENGWSLDTYASGVRSRIAEPGPQEHTNLMGLADGNLFQADETVSADAGSAIPWSIWTPFENGDDPRSDKQWGDAVVDAIPGGNGYTVTPVIDNGATALGSTIVAAGAARTTSIIGLAQAGLAGVLSRNLGLRITGSLTGTIQRPLFYLWEPSYLDKQEQTTRRVTDWEDLGYKGAKYIQGVVLRANTFDVLKSLQAQYEGGHIGVSFQARHDGETQYAYPIATDGWTPFVAELVRLVGVDDVPWSLIDWRWIWEPAPEAATQWETQYTTFDLPGYMHVADGVFAYQSICPVNVRVWHDDFTADYVLPATATEYERYYQRFEAQKGRAVKFRLTSNAPFRLFQKDCAIRVQGWGAPGGYLVARPFGGPHRESGAQV